MQRKPKSPRRRAVEQFFVHWTAALASVLARALPLRVLQTLACLVAWLVGTLSFRRQRMMERNLRAVFGDQLSAAQRRKVRRDCVINIAKTMVELLKLRWMSPEELKRQVQVEGLEHLDAALAKGAGAILITAHYGNWEYAGAILSVLGYPMNVIARDANDPLARNLINEARRSKGVKVFGRSEARELLRALKRNECVAILPDQHAAEGAVRVEFLGRPADTAAGPATFALRTGAPVIPTFCDRQPDDHFRFRLLPPLELVNTGNREADVIANTQLINDLLGQEIRAHPEQWLWLHNRWKAVDSNGR